eukprot:gene19123-6428_t
MGRGRDRKYCFRESAKFDAAAAALVSVTSSDGQSLGELRRDNKSKGFKITKKESRSMHAAHINLKGLDCLLEHQQGPASYVELTRSRDEDTEVWQICLSKGKPAKRGLRLLWDGGSDLMYMRLSSVEDQEWKVTSEEIEMKSIVEFRKGENALSSDHWEKLQ